MQKVFVVIVLSVVDNVTPSNIPEEVEVYSELQDAQRKVSEDIFKHLGDLSTEIFANKPYDSDELSWCYDVRKHSLKYRHNHNVLDQFDLDKLYQDMMHVYNEAPEYFDGKLPSFWIHEREVKLGAYWSWNPLFTKSCLDIGVVGNS